MWRRGVVMSAERGQGSGPSPGSGDVRGADARAEEEATRALIEQIAEAVHRRGLESVALALLELQKPFGPLCSQIVRAVAPYGDALAEVLAAPGRDRLFSEETLHALARVLEDPARLDQVAEAIERRTARGRPSAPPAQGEACREARRQGP